MSATDALLARFTAEVEERQRFMNGIVEAAEQDGRDLTAQELEMLARTRDRLQEVAGQLDPLREAARIASESRQRTAEIAEQFRDARDPDRATGPIEYRSAGAYVLDRWRAGLGGEEAMARLELFHRAAAHQTTADNPGLLPPSVIGPVVNFIDASRPLVSALGPRNLPSGNWSRPRVTQHTDVGIQAAEKTELVSRKMLISSLPVAAKTIGGYVNVSRQNIDWSQPDVMDLVINDLAAQYAIETEADTGTVLTAAATAEAALPADPTSDDVAAALWSAAGSIYAATGGAGRLIAAVSPDMLGLIGPLYAPINPSDSQSAGFNGAAFGPGVNGSVAGVTVVMSPGLAAGTLLVLSSAAAEIYEDRIGSLQVVEPSVLGVQVAYAGYFAELVIEPTGIRKIAKAA